MTALPSWWRNRGLRFQLAATIGMVGTAVLALNALFLSIFLGQYVVDRQGTQLGQQAALLARCGAQGGLARVISGERPLQRLMGSVVGPGIARHAVVEDGRGEVRFVSPMPSALRTTLIARLRQDLAAGRLVPDVAPSWRRLSDQIVVEVPITCSGAAKAAPRALGGGLLLSEDGSVAGKAWRRVVSLVLIIGLVATIVAILVGILAGRIISRPIRAVTETARAVAGGDHSRRVARAGPAEVNELGDAFNGMVEQVLSQRQAERDLLANVSHELASPLGLIRGYAEALGDGVISDEAQRQGALKAIAGETERLQRLTGDLLDLALLETGQVAMQIENVPLAELLTGVRDKFAPIAEVQGVQLTTDLNGSLPSARADGLRLEQVLVNLVTNALRHTPRGGTISLAAGADSSHVVLHVRDTGEGIPAEDLPRVWERFYRVEKGRDRRRIDPEVGLGLAISRSTITLMRGSISVESSPDVGTTFIVRLPRAD